MSSHMSHILQDVYLIMPPNTQFLLWHQQSFVDPFLPLIPQSPEILLCQTALHSDCS